MDYIKDMMKPSIKAADANKDIIKPRTVNFHKDSDNAISINLANQPQNATDRGENTPINESVRQSIFPFTLIHLLLFPKKHTLLCVFSFHVHLYCLCFFLFCLLMYGKV